MVYLFVLGLGFLGICVYLLVIFREVPGAIDERLGQLEALPEDVGVWKPDETSTEGKAALEQGLRREERLWHDPSGGRFGGERLVRQVRYRNLETNAIDRVDDDVVVRRRRVKAKS